MKMGLAQLLRGRLTKAAPRLHRSRAACTMASYSRLFTRVSSPAYAFICIIVHSVSGPVLGNYSIRFLTYEAYFLPRKIEYKPRKLVKVSTKKNE